MVADSETLQIPTARAFLPLLKPTRYKGARGGRGAGRSHFTAGSIIEDCFYSHQRVACLREYQSSMQESSKQLLEDKIREFGLEDAFQVTQSEIRGPYDSLVVFKGLQGNSAYSLKSLEGFTRAWVEEAQSISQPSLDTMTPTFRRGPTMDNDPEMYFTWNPIQWDDPVEQLFREDGDDPNSPFRCKDDPDFVCVTSTYRDNPWFPDDLRRDMERDRRRDHGRYAHTWLGAYQAVSAALVFSNWRVEEFETPEDALLFFGADWGFSVDPTVLIRCWMRELTLYVDYEAHQVGCEIINTPALFDQIPGSRKWPIRADSARPETISYMRQHGFPNMTPAIKGKGSVEEGIEFLKNYDIVVHPRCQNTVDELSKYSWKVDKRNPRIILPVLADDNNNVIDSLRYALEGERLAAKPWVIPKTVAQRLRLPRRIHRSIVN